MAKPLTTSSSGLALSAIVDASVSIFSCSLSRPSIRASGRGGQPHARSHKPARTTPEKAADVILKATAKNKMRVLVGGDAWLLDKVQRLLPTRYPGFLSMIFGLNNN